MIKTELFTKTKPLLSERVQKLISQIFSHNPKICIERALFVTESYMENEYKPTVIKRALGLANTLKKMTLFILDDELIVGNQISASRGVPVFPEMASRWISQELQTFRNRPERFEITSGDSAVLAEKILPYWSGKSVEDRIFGALTPGLREALDAGVFNVGLHLSKGIGHFLLDYELVLKKGCEGLIRDIERSLSSLDPAFRPEDIEKYHFLKAITIALEACIGFADRYSVLASKMAEEEQDEKRKKELAEISNICKKVPRHPAETFHEALQSFWFIQLIPHIDSDGTAISPGSFDRYMWPYLQADLEQERTTIPEAQDLIDQLWLKFNQILSLWKAEDAKYFGGFPISQNLIVGGIDRNGKDVTNPLSYMCLYATERLHLPQPALSVRLHNGTPKDFLLKAVIDVIITGVGMPALFNDEIIVPALLQRGISIHDAREYAIIGCVEPGFHGKGCCISNAAYFNLLKCLELALGKGTCLLTNKKVSPHTGDPVSFRTIDDIFEAYQKQVAYWVKQMVSIFNIIEKVHAQNIQLPFNSALISDCIEHATDYMCGGALYNLNGTQGVGIANVADSFSAIQKIVFNENKLSLTELINVLKNNFEENEDIRQYILNKVPRYGNDDDIVDQFARKVGQIYCKEVEKYTSPRGGKYHPGLYPVSANVPLGRDVAASPDGRRAQEPLADGVAPSHGSDRKGPTAVLLSISKLDQILSTNGTQLNQKFPASILKSKQEKEKFYHYLRTYISLPIMEVQFNIIDRTTLIAAQKNPEKYRNLVVRVAGYSAFFNDLGRSTQDDIIGRTEQRF